MKDLSDKIEQHRREWGPRLLVLGHYYQRESVLRHADRIGDSLELSHAAARASAAERIVFCGVHFMAESAAILALPHQTVFMPEVSAGCPMADMADADRVAAAWHFLQRHGADWIPIVYVNSSAAVKAFCGRAGGSACTSGNAERVVRWALAQGRRPFFLPDQHLGLNVARDVGLADDDVAIFDRRLPDGGLSPDRLLRARMVVWNGHCIVHVAFSVDQITQIRARHPEARIIVHPECPREVTALADAHGSTARIVEYVRAAPAGSLIFVGTELNLVERLAREQQGRCTVKALRPSVCANMAKTNEQNLAELLDQWPESRLVRVPPAMADDARQALERMLHL